MDERKRAIEAGQILNSPVFAEALDSISAHAYESWKNAKTTGEREEAWYTQRAVQVLQKEIFNVLQCAAVNAGGKDETLNEAVESAKEKITNGRSRKCKPAAN